MRLNIVKNSNFKSYSQVFKEIEKEINLNLVLKDKHSFKTNYDFIYSAKTLN